MSARTIPPQELDSLVAKMRQDLDAQWDKDNPQQKISVYCDVLDALLRAYHWHKFGAQVLDIIKEEVAVPDKARSGNQSILIYSSQFANWGEQPFGILTDIEWRSCQIQRGEVALYKIGSWHEIRRGCSMPGIDAEWVAGWNVGKAQGPYYLCWLPEHIDVGWCWVSHHSVIPGDPTSKALGKGMSFPSKEAALLKLSQQARKDLPVF